MLKILGDICFSDGYFDRGYGVGSAIEKGADPFIHLARKKNDFWIGNFECVCSDTKGQSFTIPPKILDLIKHLDLYGVANNHSMQIGEYGYNQTISYLESRGINYAGSAEKRSTTFVHQGRKVGLLAFSMRPDNFSQNPLYWHIPEIQDIVSEIKKLENCDYRIVFVHWGYEFINRPNIEQRQLAHWLIDSGVDLVVGMHPHVAQGAEEYHGKHIFYSLGNSVFNMPWTPTKYGLMINVDLSKEPIRVSSNYLKIEDDFFPKILNKVPEEFSREYLDKLVCERCENELYFDLVRKCSSLYTIANRKTILQRMLSMPMREKIALISDFTKRRLLK